MFEAVNLPGRRSVMADWLIRGALGIVFIVFGREKFPAGPGSEWIKIFQQIGLGQIGPPLNAIFTGIFLAGLIALHVSRRN